MREARRASAVQKGSREERVCARPVVRPSNWRTREQGDIRVEEVIFANSHSIELPVYD